VRTGDEITPVLLKKRGGVCLSFFLSLFRKDPLFSDTPLSLQPEVMKFSRFASLLAVVASFPALAFAAGSISVGNLSGQARAIINGETVALKQGDVVEPGSGIETNTESSLELELDGVKLVLSSGTRISIKSFGADSGLVFGEIVLLRGNIAGDVTGASSASNLSIRTTVGVVSVAGSSFNVGFSPTSPTSGNMSVVSLQGNAAVTSLNTTGGAVAVPAGSQMQVGTSGTGSQVAPVAPSVLAAISKTISTGTAALESPVITQTSTATSTSTTPAATAASAATTPAVVVPNLAVVAVNGKLTTISPNGEGTSGL
jgi:hypothetical protein